MLERDRSVDVVKLKKKYDYITFFCELVRILYWYCIGIDYSTYQYPKPIIWTRLHRENDSPWHIDKSVLATCAASKRYKPRNNRIL